MAENGHGLYGGGGGWAFVAENGHGLYGDGGGGRRWRWFSEGRLVAAGAETGFPGIGHSTEGKGILAAYGAGIETKRGGDGIEDGALDDDCGGGAGKHQKRRWDGGVGGEGK